jgi:hypothetical protein
LAALAHLVWRPAVSRHVVGWSLVLAFAVNCSWLLSGDLEYLRLGYYLWVASFALLAVAAWFPRTRGMMALHERGNARLPAALLAAAVAAATISCDSGTAPGDPGDASYSVAPDPAPIIHATAICDRYLSYAILSLGRRVREFSLSINIMNDCTPGGGIWTYGEVYIEGDYAIAATALTFTPEPGRTPPFAGSFDGAFVRLTLPPRADSLGATPIPVQLGPRMPF